MNYWRVRVVVDDRQTKTMLLPDDALPSSPMLDLLRSAGVVVTFEKVEDGIED